MRDILRLIEDQAGAYGARPMFSFLRDTSIPPERRLAFAPSAAHYVLTFTDFCERVLRQEPTEDPIQKIVNAQTYEEAEHSRWFLEDLEALGCDPVVRFSDALKFVWSSANARSRVLSYELCRFGLAADPIRRLVLVHCVEATAEIMVGHVMKVGKEWSKLTGRPLKFFGQTHEAAEEEHSFKGEDVQRVLEGVRLDARTKEELEVMVRVTFEHFSAFTDELLEAAAAERRPDRW
jgi:hypothetical protein